MRRGPWIILLLAALPACGEAECGERAADGRCDSGGSASGLTVASDSATSGVSTGTSTTGNEKLDVAPGGDGGNGGEGGGMVCEQDVDIVFVMDVSTSMDAFLNKLAQEILVVDAALAQLNLPSAPHYGLAVFVDDAALLNGGAPYADVASLQADFQMWSTFTASNSQVGGGNQNTTWPENSLDALYLAATGFQWRPAEDTLRLIIHTTDDTFWEGPATQNGVMIQHDYAETVTSLQDREIRGYSFAAMIGGPLSDQDVTPGFFGPYMGMPSIGDATGGGVWNIDDVLAGTVSLSAAINGAVDDTMCEPYPTPG